MTVTVVDDVVPDDSCTLERRLSRRGKSSPGATRRASSPGRPPVSDTRAGSERDPVRAWDEFYRDLHRHPELSLQEHRTAGIVADRLRSLGLQVAGGIGRTGVVGVLRNGSGPTVLLRADMDALPVKEDTGLPYTSTARGTDPDGRDVPMMHACGHDMHVTCLLAAITELAANRQVT